MQSFSKRTTRSSLFIFKDVILTLKRTFFNFLDRITDFLVEIIILLMLLLVNKITK